MSASGASTRGGSPTAVVAAHEFFRRGEANAEGWSMLIGRGRNWESAYRDRWAHDKVVRSTHGVNCTGSCSWNVYVKEGLITWETQAVDYPRTDPDRPDHEPRGCPRGARSAASAICLRTAMPFAGGSTWFRCSIVLWLRIFATTSDLATRRQNPCTSPNRNCSRRKNTFLVPMPVDIP